MSLTPIWRWRESVCSGCSREVVELAGVQLDHPVHFLVGHVLEGFGGALTTPRPVRVGVWVIALPGDVVDADVVANFDPEVILDEAAVKVLAEQVTWQNFLVDVLVEAVLAPHAVDALQDVGNPADAAFAEPDLELRVLVQGR